MSRPYRRFVAWTEDKAPPLHRFLTNEGAGWSWARTLVGFGLLIGIGVLLLWGLTGQSLGEPPVVVIESGSMMHCEEGPGTPARVCGATAVGRLGTIDPGDLVFVRDTDGQETVDAFADAGSRDRHGMPGDVIVYSRPGAPPIIHRAMFWVDIHSDGTYSIPALGVSREQSTDVPELTGPEAVERFRLRDSHSRPCELSLPLDEGPAASGFVTKGDNNDCWDQGSVLPSATGPYRPDPVRPSEIIGKARGELPWVGLLKLFVFDLLSGQLFDGVATSDYENAPADLQWAMWLSVGALVGIPYGVEVYVKKKREREEAEGRDDA